MTQESPHTPSPKQRIQILTLYAAARRVYTRHFEGQDAETGTLYWTGWHVTRTLRFPAPLIRLALTLERDHHEVVEIIARYHPLREREPETCRQAYTEFTGLYEQMKRRPLYVVG